MVSNPYAGNGCGYDGCGYGYTPLSSAASTPLLLDDLPQFRVAVATKKLRTAYSGNCWQIRRSSDSSTQNTGFVDGVVDQASDDAFCGAGSGYLAAWYDQSGSGNDLSNSTTGSQPVLVTSGTPETANGNPAVLSVPSRINRIDSPSLTYTRPFHRFAVVRFAASLSASGFVYVWDGDADDRASLFTASGGDSSLSMANGAQLIRSFGASLASQTVIVEALYNGASSKLRINDLSSTGDSGTGTLPTKLRLFCPGSSLSSSYVLDGHCLAFLDYDGELTTEQVTTVREGLADLFGVAL